MTFWDYTTTEIHPDTGTNNQPYIQISLIRKTDSKSVTVVLPKAGITVPKIIAAVKAELAKDVIPQTIDII